MTNSTYQVMNQIHDIKKSYTAMENTRHTDTQTQLYQLRNVIKENCPPETAPKILGLADSLYIDSVLAGQMATNQSITHLDEATHTRPYWTHNFKLHVGRIIRQKNASSALSTNTALDVMRKDDEDLEYEICSSMEPSVAAQCIIAADQMKWAAYAEGSAHAMAEIIPICIKEHAFDVANEKFKQPDTAAQPDQTANKQAETTDKGDES